jgi:hypothetical protein
VAANVPTTGSLSTPAYVDAVGGDLLITAPAAFSDPTWPVSNLVAHVPASGSATSGIARRAIVGMIRKPGAPIRVISLLATPDGRARGLAVSTLAADGTTLSATTRLPQALPELGSVAFAQNAAGQGVLAWAESRTGGDADPIERDRLRIRVATGAWGAFGTPRTLRELRGQSAQLSPALAASVNARGDAVVASDALGVTAWRGDAARGRFEAAITRPAPTIIGPLRAAITDDGRAVLAWRTSNGDAMDPHGPVDVYAATIAPRARGFAPIQRVHRAPENYPSNTGIDLASVPGGGATLVFSAPRGELGARLGEAVYATSTDRRGRFGARQRIADQGTAGGLAVRADGATIVSFTSSSGSGPAVLAARLRLPGAGAFGPTESLGQAPAQVGDQPVTTQSRYRLGSPPPDAPLPSFDPVTGRPLIAFTVAATASEPGRVVVLARERP